MSQPLQTTTWVDRARLPARLAYILILLLATLVPFSWDPTEIRERLVRAFEPYSGGLDVIDGVRNVVLFAGWGAVWALTTAGSASRAILRATLTGALISITVEGLQLLSSNRKSSILDVSTNTLGSFLGALGLITLIYLARERRGARSFVGIPTVLFAASYTAAVFFEAFSPLFSMGNMHGAHGGPFARLRFALDQMSWESLYHVTRSDLIIFLPAGALLVAAWTEAGLSYRVALVRAVVTGWLLAIFAEILHGGLGQRIEWGAILLHGVSITLGAVLAWKYLARLTNSLRGRNRVLALIVVYVAVLVVWAWRPLVPETSLSSIATKFDGDWYIPLAGLSLRYDFFTVVDVCNQFLLYLPFGALLAVWPLRRKGALAGPLPAMWVALVLETGQIMVMGRMLDVTDMMVMVSGASIGWAVVRRAGYPIYGVLDPKVSS